MDDLKQIRVFWQSSYIAGDIERLKVVEDENFSVTVGGKTMLRTERYQRMSGALMTGRWHPRNTRFVDYDLELKKLDRHLVMVKANTSIYEGDNFITSVNTVENWIFTISGWKIRSLDYRQACEVIT